MRALVLLLPAAILMPSCGGASPDAETPSEPATSLTITARSAPGEEPIIRTLTCDPAGGTHHDPESACAKLRELAHPFAETPADTACTEIYGGPQTVRVEGTFEGAAVSTTFSRRDGCEIGRWQRHRFLFPPAIAGALGPA